MFISQALLAALLLLWGLNGLFSLHVNVKLLYVLAVATGIFLILEGFGLINKRLLRG